MNTSLFFRVEDAKGRGPYNTGTAARENIAALFNDLSGSYVDTHPVPWNDPILSRTWSKIESDDEQMSFIFGFASLDDVFNWFHEPEELAYMVKYKMRISCYRATSFIHGCGQSVAKKASLTLVDYVEF